MEAGIIIYDGPSMIDGKPIVCVATMKTANPKTGQMIQTWILRKFVKPHVAINTGSDFSVCGDCPLRGILVKGVNRGRGCYVSVRHAPFNVYNALKRGNYPKYNKEEHADCFRGRKLRLGSYGEPVALPLGVWRTFFNLCSGSTGYTHQWRVGKFRWWKRYVMASVHNLIEKEEAKQAGWRTYRSRLEGQPLAPDEFVCPASDEAGHRLSCDTCMACKGGRPEQVNPVIIVHGGDNVLSAARRLSA